MAFDRNSNAQRNDNQGSTGTHEEKWKAEGFINVTLTLPGQNPISMPSMPLKADKFANLIKWLQEDPTRVAKLLPCITLDYKSAKPAAKVFDFSALG